MAACLRVVKARLGRKIPFAQMYDMTFLLRTSYIDMLYFSRGFSGCEYHEEASIA